MEGRKTMPINAERLKDRPTVVIGYTNWRGEYGEREIVPMHPWFGATDWHPELQWLLKAWDVAKDAERDFAIKDIGFKGRTTPTVNLEAGAGDLVARLRSAARKVRALKEWFTLTGAAKTTLHRLAETSDQAAAQLAAVTAERDEALALVNYAEDISKQLDARATAAEARIEQAYKAGFDFAMLTKSEDNDLAAENARLREALKWFVDRSQPIQAKFALHGPKDTADAMVDAFRAARAALSQEAPK